MDAKKKISDKKCLKIINSIAEFEKQLMEF